MTEPLEPLRPLTPEEQDAFDNRRDTASVIQNRCRHCNAWYESPKRTTPYEEVFVCDCGAPMSFVVPPLDSKALVFDILDTDQKLDTGMLVREAVANACYWWNHTGRHVMKKDGGKGHEFAASLNPEDPNYIPSGIVNGEPWDVLTKRERTNIVKHWHHHFVRKPQTL